MQRREFMHSAAALAASGIVGRGTSSLLSHRGAHDVERLPDEARRLVPPGEGAIPVAFVISDNFTLIDVTGPWQVFINTFKAFPKGVPTLPNLFQPYFVAPTKDPVKSAEEVTVTPDHDIRTAPTPKITVIPAQADLDPEMLAWIKRVHATNDLTMSVCTGAFALAATGLLDGLSATTHHVFTAALAKAYPRVHVKPGLRFVESSPKLATAGGLTSGIDLALHVVERYFGQQHAQDTADWLEYRSREWVA